MPHQCLKCGKVFEDGSPDLLKGCPVCGGNKFLYINKPLSEEERRAISENLKEDLNSKIVNIFSEEGDINSKRFKEVKPKDIRKVLKQLSEQTNVKEKKEVKFRIDKEKRRAMLSKLEKESSNEPETIRIKEPGKYELNLKELLRDEVIIIQKDGSYTIHLPSIFDSINKDKKKL